MPLLPKTGKSLEACYAAPLKDCSEKLSREHYISKSLLHYLNRSQDLRVGGLPWLKDGERTVPPNALAAKILCDRHNRALSSVDMIALHLFQAFDEEGAVDSGRQLIRLFSGHDVERWLLKILCSLSHLENMNLHEHENVSIEKVWLEVLFGYIDFPEEQGLYVCNTLGYRFEGPWGLQLRTISRAGRLSGLGLWICGYELILSLSGFSTRRFDGRSFAYRPGEFYTRGREFEKSIILSWNGIADLGTVSLEIDGT